MILIGAISYAVNAVWLAAIMWERYRARRSSVTIQKSAIAAVCVAVLAVLWPIMVTGSVVISAGSESRDRRRHHNYRANGKG